jgi:alpha-galactosidase
MVERKHGSLLALCFICCCVALIGVSLTRPQSDGWGVVLAKPGWMPASWLFAPVWTVYFGLMSAIEKNDESAVVEAARYDGALGADGFPDESAWKMARALSFKSDWQGKNPDDARATEVRLLWTPERLYVKFQASYRNITIFSDAKPNGWRDELWDRDVAELFLQPDSSDPLKYKEFEVSPNGFWIDLDISHGERQDLQSGLRHRVHIDERSRKWIAELAIPMKSLTPQFNAKAVWRVNFYRVEGPAEPRFYSAWRPTNTPKPNFHVPEAFGRLVFESERSRRP